MLTENTAVIAETGDSWFNCQKLKLPEGCTYEFQMQYGSIGWAVGATLGYAQGTNKERRVIACIGDGSFQVRPLLHSFFYIERRSLLKALLQCIVNHFFSTCCALKMVKMSVVYHLPGHMWKYFVDYHWRFGATVPSPHLGLSIKKAKS
jgi:TPP-dependent trihydroxycyclohexane-1,2-dione (THcHDO) dehydratase